ncbi:HlyD family efflux transporter periplasmic adaptor subunit [Enterococcus sp. BWB1-3]|uniref:HlyD family efflux transporter periplasmic adaptor subunit n=1 Tax=Enterococcus sp. BWB1-3 TaxID=2787713 RepID=UPI00192123AF|nr:HlyD family secretion protein [Enterococcus sp. BWB1-3]MBL1231075.1 HlyD family efflux transporter periplasmic adaptor subunit [Enterococcus sp. BWB1-3]
MQLNEKYKTEETALTDLNNEKITKETQLSNLKEKNFYVEDTINKIRQDTLSSIENSITTTQNTLKTEKDKSASLQNDIDVNTITSTKDGIVNILNEINKGDILSGNANVMQLVPRKDKYFIQASIPENEIAKVKEGMAVKCKFNSIPYQEYGKISGKIVQISEAFFQNEEKSTNYYIAEVEIEVENLKNKKGDLLEIKAGMLAEIEIITGNESGLEWILKKINLTD